MAAAKKKPADTETPKKPETQSEKPKKEPVVISDVVTETPAAATTDPLTDFKEKMIEEEETPVSDMRPKKNYMWPILFIFIIALLLLGGIFVYKQGMNKGTQVNVVTLTPTPTIIPKPTKAVDLTKYEMQVLNGSEVSGEAGKQKESLEAKGFTVSSIGNAGKSDYTKTIIQAKKEVDQAYLDKLRSVLEESFVVGETEELAEDRDPDVVVILGSETN